MATCSPSCAHKTTCPFHPHAATLGTLITKKTPKKSYSYAKEAVLADATDYGKGCPAAVAPLVSTAKSYSYGKTKAGAGLHYAKQDGQSCGAWATLGFLGLAGCKHLGAQQRKEAAFAVWRSVMFTDADFDATALKKKGPILPVITKTFGEVHYSNPLKVGRFLKELGFTVEMAYDPATVLHPSGTKAGDLLGVMNKTGYAPPAISPLKTSSKLAATKGVHAYIAVVMTSGLHYVLLANDGMGKLQVYDSNDPKFAPVGAVTVLGAVNTLRGGKFYTYTGISIKIS